jgi:hypothetical protein
MSVWQSPTGTSLSSPEGRLLLLSITVEPRRLESLLEVLARLDFPVNPQIYHDASVTYEFSDGHQKSLSTTLVEFPAYDVRLQEVRTALEDSGFDGSSVHALDMLDEIHSGGGHRKAFGASSRGEFRGTKTRSAGL